MPAMQRRTLPLLALVLTLGTTVLAVLPVSAAAPEPAPVTPTLIQRATLSADHQAEGPPSGAQATAANGRTGPFPGQVIPGFSGMLDNGDGTFWGLPDNGFGAKGNSADFLLRLYHITPTWETGEGGPGEVTVGAYLSLRDPDGRIDFPIVHADTAERLLTGADFDVESVVRAPDGTLWIGEEFGPFLLHFDATGKLLAAPVPFAGGKSPQNPYLAVGEVARVRSSRGFEAMASSVDGTMLYPIVEGSLADETDLRRRWIYEFDTRSMQYTGRTWAYQVDTDDNVIGDASTTGDGRMILIERDNLDGPAAFLKRIYEIDLWEQDDEGFVRKDLVVDLLKIANPDRIGTATSPGAYGVGDPFSFPMQSVEVVVDLGDGRLLIANDNNYPGNAARLPGTPDDTELIVLDLRRVRPLAGATVIGHRGASGYRPEHTLASYQLAITQCADYIEPDLVSTRDGVLVARHENEISGTTDVAARAEFADRRTTKVIDGTELTGWFTEDFTLAELRTLRAKERIPEVRPANTAFDGLYQIPTFQEVVDLARNSRTCDGRPVGIAPETKHPSYFDSIGLSMEESVVAVLEAAGFTGADAPVRIQSFETTNLRELDGMTDLPLVQLVDCSGAPYDLQTAGNGRTYADLVTARGLAEISRYADAVGLCKDLMIPRNPDGSLGRPTNVIADAHRNGLEVIGWTFRRENQYLPLELRSSTDPNAPGDMRAEVERFLRAGMDSAFTDNPDVVTGVATPATSSPPARRAA